MCYNVQIEKKLARYEERFKAKSEQTALFQPQSEISGFTFPKLPIIREEGKIEMLNWGLIPHWSKDETIRKNTLNARVETRMSVIMGSRLGRPDNRIKSQSNWEMR